MVHNDVLLIHASESVTLMVCHLAVAKTETHITKNDIACLNRKGIVCYTDAVTRRRLSCNGHITLRESQF